MPWFGNILLQIYFLLAESCFSLTLAGHHRILQPFLVLDNTHSFATATSRCLYHYGIFNLSCQFQSIIYLGNSPLTTGNDRHPCLFHCLSRFTFISHFQDYFFGWSNESNITGFANLCKIGILCQKSISRMDRISTSNFRCADYIGDIKITLIRRCWSNADALISKPRM